MKALWTMAYDNVSPIPHHIETALVTSASFGWAVMGNKHEKYHRLIAQWQALHPMHCTTAHPCDESSLRSALEAAQPELLAPILVGPEQRIRAVAAEYQLGLPGYSIVDAPHSDAFIRSGGEPGARRQGRCPDEGQPAYRRTDGRRGQARYRPAHQSSLCHERVGNMLAKSLIFLAGADSAGIVLGARVPVTLTIRADSLAARLASCVVAALVACCRRNNLAKAVG